MKRIALLLMALCLLFLSACGTDTGDPNVYDVEYGGKIYTVDYNSKTISFDGHVCRFEISGGGNSTRFEVTYPDGSSYWMNWSGNSGHGGHGGGYDESRYVSGYTLWNVLEQGRPNARQNSNHAGLGFLLLLFGIFETAFPQASWYLSHGWRYKNAEPSDLALGLGRATGVVMIVIGIICFFV